jgi:hypothetical protein
VSPRRRLREAFGEPMSRTVHEGEREDALPRSERLGGEMYVQLA